MCNIGIAVVVVNQLKRRSLLKKQLHVRLGVRASEIEDDASTRTPGANATCSLHCARC